MALRMQKDKRIREMHFRKINMLHLVRRQVAARQLKEKRH